MRVADLGLDSRIVEILKKQGIEELYPPQADSLLRHRTQWLQQLSVVVADEVHLINDSDRGPTLEVTLAKLRQVNPRAQVLALSATIKNSDQLAKWLEAEHIKSEWRPVPLKEGVYHGGLVHFTDQSVQEVKPGEDDISGLVVDIMASGGQALIFVSTRRSTEALAKALGSQVKAELSEKNREQLEKIAASLAAAQEEPTSMAARLAKCIGNGVAFHNAGLTNGQRSIVEKEFKRGRIAAIVATPTLASGINLPARRVLIRDLNRYDVNFGLSPIPVLEIKQMCGRAGRPKYDKYGEAIIFGKRTRDLYIDPLSAVKMRDALHQARDDRFFHLWTICTTPDMPKLYLRRGDYAWVEQKIEEADLTFPVEDYDFFLAEVKTASLLDDWITERTEEEVTKKFGIGPGDIRRMTDQAEGLLYSMGGLGRIFNKKKVRAVTRLTIQVQYGINEDLLELISLRGVGRVRGRALFQRGYKTLKDLQKGSPSAPAPHPTIGPTLAMKIKEQVGVPVDVREIEGQAALGDFP